MASFDAALSWWGVHLDLAHPEVDAVTTAQDIDRALVSIAGGVPASPYDLALAATARHIAMHGSLVTQLDRGNGVSFTIPWSAIWWGQWWLVVPNTR